ncbi:MAG: calcium/sodium antiporter [Fervidobacterium sp.]
MILSLLLLFVGIFLVYIGSDKLVDGASALAKKLRVSDLLIGLTIVSFGTSAPELAVNIVSSIKGTSDISLGNVIGSNIFNILAVVGLSAILREIAVKHSTLRKETPLSLIAAIALLALGNKTPSVISRGDGVVLLLFFSIFISYVLEMAKTDREFFEESEKLKEKELSLPVSLFYILFGLAGLVFGGRWIVSGAVDVARYFGVSEKLIGLTIVAAGTSIPELATSLVAAAKGNSEISLGNVVGSNIFNIFFILGISSVIRPINYPAVLNFDIIILIAITVLLLFFSANFKISRKEGIIFFAIYILYTVYIILRK